MTYSYTQISQYLTCPRRYRHRYLDGWKEKDTRAAMLFGRAFERALGAYFRREDPGAILFSEWSDCQSQELHYSNRDSWDRMLRARNHALGPVLPGRSYRGPPAST
jgi:CRISPR/Cas system-associated exonuclease Cas4 (RecB family)